MNINDFEMMEPMKYYDNPEPKTDALRKKRQDMIDNKDNLYIASEKHDGDFGLFAHFSKGHNLIRSRSISKVTGVYGDYTAKLPHLCEEMDNWPDNTVVLAEICWDKYNTNANTVGTILRCLPAKAVERQKNEKLVGYIFDVLMLNNNDLTATPYETRITKCAAELLNYQHNYFKRTAIFSDGIDFMEAADEIISAGGEGIVIQKKSNPYMPGTRTAWATLKLKKSLPHMDVKVIDTIEPNKQYCGDFIDDWKYWEFIDGSGEIHYINRYVDEEFYQLLVAGKAKLTAVTKPYVYRWKNGITVLLPNGETTDVTSGLTDDDRAYLTTAEAQQKIAAGELWAEIKAMSFNDKNKLRHASLVRLRSDLDADGE